VIARALRDSGCEVIYLGIRQSPEEIASAAIEEDVSVVGISLLSGAHLALTAAVRKSLDNHGAEDVPLICGGIIPEDDHDELRRIGAKAIFTPGTSMREIEDTIRTLDRTRWYESESPQVIKAAPELSPD
jgi:methylmalonyl-CoA mutase C-terminal domain/subunit